MGKKEELLERLLNLDDDKLSKLLDNIEDKPTRKQNRNSNLQKGTGKPTKKRRGKKKNPNIVKGRRDKGAAAIPSAMDLSGNRPNKFLDMGLDNKFKQDTELQKKLTGDFEFIERRESIKLLEATCSQCEYIYSDVHPSEVVKDGGTLYFVCDDCQRRD